MNPTCSETHVNRGRGMLTSSQQYIFFCRGKFGRVLKCRDWDTGEVFAAKFVLCTKREDQRNVQREIQIMNALKNPKLLRLFDAYDNGRNELTLITE